MSSKYKLAVGIIIVIGVVLVLILPKYHKHQLLVKARTAAERGKEIAFLLDKYKNQYKHFAPDFAPLELSFECAREAQNAQLVCDDYTYRMESGTVLRVQHTALPQWFEIDVENGAVTCESEPDSPRGEYICRHAYVPSAL